MLFKVYEEEKYGLYNKVGEWRDVWVIYLRIKLGKIGLCLKFVIIMLNLKIYYFVGIVGRCVGLIIYLGVWYIFIGIYKLGVYIFELLICKESKYMFM